jgi:hypothetical protein
MAAGPSSNYSLKIKKMKKSIFVGRQLSRQEQKLVVGGNAACTTCSNGSTLCAGGVNSTCSAGSAPRTGNYVICTNNSTGAVSVHRCNQR